MKAKQFKNKYRDLEELSRDCATIVNNEPTFTLTLATGTVSTSITNALVGNNSVIVMTPESAEAARLNATWFISSKGDGTFSITHATATVTASFSFFVQG